MILCRPVYQRASLIAFSFASAPPFVKNDISRSPGVTSASRRASVERGSVAIGGAGGARRDFRQQARERGARLGRHRRADRAQLLRLLLDGGNDLGVLVPDRDVDE